MNRSIVPSFSIIKCPVSCRYSCMVAIQVSRICCERWSLDGKFALREGMHEQCILQTDEGENRSAADGHPSNEEHRVLCVVVLRDEGLEVELEKQHVEGYHNRIAYFGRVLGGGGGGGPGGAGGSGRMHDAANSIRLVGVYEHGDFILRR